MIRAVHQFVSSFVPFDAVSGHTIEVQKVLRELGLESEIYVKDTRGEVRSLARFYRSYTGGPDGTALLYQAATGSRIAEFLLDRAEPKIVNYHNLTPPSYFAAWEPHSAVELDVGLRQVADLAGVTALAVADSHINRCDLEAMGYRDVEVVPVLVDLHRFERDVDEAEADRLTARKGSATSWLFVGRLAPNKAQHDLVRALAAYRRIYDPAATLDLVGTPASDRYKHAVEAFVTLAGLDDAVSLPGSVSDGALAAHFATADVFVCLSEHEGFCIPLLEAMHHGVPVVAYAAGAVPETLGGAGLVLDTKDPVTVAAAVHRVVSDSALREDLVARGRRRLGDFALERTRARFRTVMEEFLSS